jgi:hypothetical protein
MLGIEPLLRARLAEIPELLGVYGLPDLAEAQQRGKPCPCAFVAFDGYRVLETTHQNRSARIETRWLVVLAVRSAAQTADGAPARAALSPLANAVISKLMGWSPAAPYKHLALDTAPSPIVEAGSLLFPLAFTSIHVVTGA